MSFLRQLRVRCQPYMNAVLRHLRPDQTNARFMRSQKSTYSDGQLDKDREEIARKVVSLVLAHIDGSYKPDPVLVQHTKMEIEKYIDVRVTQRFAEQVELQGLRQRFEAITKEDMAKVHAYQEVRKENGAKSEVRLSKSQQEVPVGEDSHENLSVSADNIKVVKKKKKSFLRKVFKRLPKRSKTHGKDGAEKKPSLMQRIVRKIPVV